MEMLNNLIVAKAERLDYMKQLARPAFKDVIKLQNRGWSEKRIEELASRQNEAYAKMLDDAKKSPRKPLGCDIFFEVFIPAVIIPLTKTLFFWRFAIIDEEIYTVEDFSFSSEDVVDSETLFNYIKKLPEKFRKTHYKRIGLNPAIISRIERVLQNGELEVFENLLLASPSETKLFCLYFGRLIHYAPLSLEEYAELDMGDKYRFLSLVEKDFMEDFKKLRRETRHLSPEEQYVAFDHLLTTKAGEMVEKFYHWEPYMDEESREIIFGIIDNPLFFALKDYYDELVAEGAAGATPNTSAPINNNQQTTEAHYLFEWPEWDVFNEKTSKGISPKFEFLTKLVEPIQEDLASPEGYEHFKEFMNLIAAFGSIDNDANMKALLQFFTGRAFDGAAEKIVWLADDFRGRVIYFVVQWISNDSGKLGKASRMVSFTYSSGVQKDTGLDNPSGFLQSAKRIDESVMKQIHDNYDFFPETKKEAANKK